MIVKDCGLDIGVGTLCPVKRDYIENPVFVFGPLVHFHNQIPKQARDKICVAIMNNDGLSGCLGMAENNINACLVPWVIMVCDLYSNVVPIISSLGLVGCQSSKMIQRILLSLCMVSFTNCLNIISQCNSYGNLNPILFMEFLS